uniref:C2H2-type domain-containing protein n=1 Tax=Kalanchoe fedtschenkoi TaxID=63787 RepID=A0A7N0U956_KALFE
MPGLTCNACNKEFDGDAEQKLHYKSEWHRYNLQRKIAGVPGVTEALFSARQAALAAERSKESEAPMLYSCGICNKGYRSAKAHAQHLQSRAHIVLASQGNNGVQQGETVIIKPLPQRVQNNSHVVKEEVVSEENEDSDDEWEEVDPEEAMIEDVRRSFNAANMKAADAEDVMEESDAEEDMFEEVLNPSTCFMCDKEHDSIENCIVHLHKAHGFFIPDVEYLKDPKGLLMYLGLKVKKDFACLYCNDRRQPFSSLEAVRKHMDAKSHCKVHYGDDGEDEEVELEEFYDYSSSYADMGGMQLVAADDVNNDVELGSGGSELIITKRAKDKVSTKTLGSREFMRYYRQKPCPASPNDSAITIALSSRCDFPEFYIISDVLSGINA